MKNKIFLFFLIFFASLSVGALSQSQPPQKDKNKETRAKTEHSDAKLTKASESKEKINPVAKIDTLKIKLKDVKSELDSIVFAGSKFKLVKKNAHASYYHNKFNGRRTASGKRFDNNGYTAAHKKLPFGTKVRVTNEATGKSVIVEITDRGPFSKVREIDLSRKAFMEIASNKSSGVVIVTIEEVLPPK